MGLLTAPWLTCPETDLLELRAANILNIRKIDTHYTPAQPQTQNNATIYNNAHIAREVSTSEFALKVKESITRATSNIVPVLNEIVVRATSTDGKMDEVFSVGEEVSERTKEHSVSYKKIASTEKYVPVPVRTITLKPRSKVLVTTNLYTYKTIKSYLLDIVLDREHSLINWTTCFPHMRTWNFGNEPAVDRVKEVLESHQNTLSENEARIEYRDGQVIVANIPVQIHYSSYNLDVVEGDQERI